MRMTPELFLAAQLDELVKLGYDAWIEDGRIVVRLTAEQAIFIQASTVLSGKGWRR